MSERLRLETLCTREGVEGAKQWARDTAELYRRSINDPSHYASQADTKPRFQESLAELKRFAETGVITDEATATS
jgi:hypothetical protein